MAPVLLKGVERQILGMPEEFFELRRGRILERAARGGPVEELRLLLEQRRERGRVLAECFGLAHELGEKSFRRRIVSRLISGRVLSIKASHHTIGPSSSVSSRSLAGHPPDNRAVEGGMDAAVSLEHGTHQDGAALVFNLSSFIFRMSSFWSDAGSSTPETSVSNSRMRTRSSGSNVTRRSNHSRLRQRARLGTLIVGSGPPLEHSAVGDPARFSHRICCRGLPPSAQ